MAEASKSTGHIMATIGVVMTALLTTVSVALLIFEGIFAPVTAPGGADVAGIAAAYALYGYALFAVATIVLGFLNTLSGRRFALQALKIVAIVLGAAALLTAIRLFSISLRYAPMSHFPSVVIQEGLWAAGCVLAPALICALVAFWRLHTYRRRARET